MKTAYTKAIKDRFMEAVLDIVRKNKLSGGKIDTVGRFAESIGQSPQNFSKFSRQEQHVSSTIIEAACRKYRINPTWLYLNEGEMYLGEDVGNKAHLLEKRVEKLERMLGEKPKLKRV